MTQESEWSLQKCNWDLNTTTQHPVVRRVSLQEAAAAEAGDETQAEVDKAVWVYVF